MPPLLKSALFAIPLTLSTLANAAFVNTDWKTQNDALSVLHEETGIEWLKLTETAGLSINEVQSQLGQGEAFEGWRIATLDDVGGLFDALYPNQHYDDNGIHYGARNAYQSFTNVFGWNAITKTSSYTTYRSYGYTVDDAGAEVFMSGVSLISSSNSSRVYHQAGGSNVHSSYFATGVYLISDGGVTLSSILDPSLNINNANAPINNVPAPFALGAFALCLIGLSRHRKAI